MDAGDRVTQEQLPRGHGGSQRKIFLKHAFKKSYNDKDRSSELKSSLQIKTFVYFVPSVANIFLPLLLAAGFSRRMAWIHFVRLSGNV